MSLAMAKHILVKDKELASEIKRQLSNGADFAQLAQRYSTCPSKKRGGDLGEIRKGDLVKPVENVVFKQALKKVHGPVSSKFGYHLIVVYFRD